jgi:hypothetical protein
MWGHEFSLSFLECLASKEFADKMFYFGQCFLIQFWQFTVVISHAAYQDSISMSLLLSASQYHTGAT